MPTFSFQNPIPDLAFAKPKALRLGSATYETPAWAKVLEEAARAMLDGARTRTAALAAAKRFSWMGGSDRGMARPCELEPDVWLELHQGSHGILVRTKMLLEECGYPLNRASLEYEETPREEAKTKGGEASSSRAPEKTYTTSAKSAKPGKDATKARPKSGVGRSVEGVGAYAKRMLTKALSNGLVPESDFFKLLDSKPGETGAFRLSGHPLFSRSMITTDGNNRTYSEPIQNRFGFPVYLNSQWRDNHRKKLEALLAKWGVEDDVPVSSPPTFVQQTLPGLPEPKRSSQAGRKDKSKRKIGAQEKIGAYAKRMLFQALAEKGRIPDKDFKTLQTTEGTKALLGISLTTCPLFSLSPMIRRDGRRGCWNYPATHDGRPVYVNSQWYEEYRPKLDKLFARWNLIDNPVTPDIESNLVELLEAEFPNGVRPGSIIDQNRLRRYYRQNFDGELPSDFDFGQVLPRLGIVRGGKVFPRPSEKDGGWRKILDGLVAQGHAIFEFSRVMRLLAANLLPLGVTSEEMLRKVVETASDAFSIDGDFFFPKSLPRPTIINPDAVLIEESALLKRFPYVEKGWLENRVRNAPGAIRNSAGVYALAGNIVFDDTEVSEGKRRCAESVSREGFFSLGELALDDSASMNDSGLSPGALRLAFFQRFLAGDFDHKGQIVCKKGSPADSRFPLRAFLRTHAEVSFEQVAELAKECNIAGWFALLAAHEELVRADRDRFVSPNQAEFETEAIDDAIDVFCPGDATTFGSIGSYAGFPAVPGFAWNDYLLEAFLRRESVRFRIVSVTAAAKDVSGAIVRKASSIREPADAFARLALSWNISPDADLVGNYLVSSRCILRRGGSIVAEVVARMHALTKGKGKMS